MASGYFCLMALCCCIKGVSALDFDMGNKYNDALGVEDRELWDVDKKVRSRESGV